MGKGSALKGKKGNAASCAGSPGDQLVCVSEEVQPRHYVYVGKAPPNEAVGATKGSPTKGSKGASTWNAEKGTGKPGGKADKGKGLKGGKPSGSSPSSGGDQFETPTPKRRTTECLESGTPPTRPNPNPSPTTSPNDPKLTGTGTPKGHGCNTKGAWQKGVVDQGGKGKQGGKTGAKGAKGAGVGPSAADQGVKGALDQTGKGKTGTTKGAAHQSDGKGSNGATAAADGSDNSSMASNCKGKIGKGAAGLDQKGTTKGAVDQSTKGAVDQGVKGGLDHKGKGKKGTTKGADQSGGKSSNGAAAVDPSRDDTSLDHGAAVAPDQTSGKGTKGKPTSKGKTVCDPVGKGTKGSDGKGETKSAPVGKGKKGSEDGKGKTKCAPVGKGKKGSEDGKGKTKCAPVGKGKKGSENGKGKTKCAPVGEGNDVATADQTGHASEVGKRPVENEEDVDRRVRRRVSILRMDTGISTMSDGNGPVEMEPLATSVDLQRIPDAALTGPGDIPLQQRKALNESLRRRMKNGQGGLHNFDYNDWSQSIENKLTSFEAYGKGSFEFLKAFLLDRENLASITVEPYYEELSETKDKETFTELPLCLIKEKYEHLPGGQTGKKHPQSDSENMMIYKVFDSIKTSSSNINRCGNRTSATMTASNNKAERTAIAEVLQAKAASMTIRDLCDKAVYVAAGLGGCGLANQEGLIAQLGKITQQCITIRDEMQQMVFDAKPLEECLESMQHYKPQLQDFQIQVNDAEGIWQGQERRKASAKRKLEKAEEKKKKEAAKAAGEEMEEDDDAGQPDEEWDDMEEENKYWEEGAD
ncbi:unnamed protein product [Symbiodinium sp. CCMP2592]|nr:unnamed protein product [Symbiodinium sp. CCMP2592]